MAARINTIIGQQAFELIRNRIGQILAEELAQQYYLTSDEDLNAQVWVDRYVRFDSSEVPCINVSFATGDYGNQHQGQSDGEFVFNVDCYSKAESQDDESNGDSAAMFKVQKLLGVCRYILEDPQYKTLGFVAPFIKNRHARQLIIANPDGGDVNSVVMARMVFVVRAPDLSQLLTAPVVAGSDTVVQLYLTEKGYVFTGNYFPQPPTTDVTVNINGVEFAMVEAGGELDIDVTDQDGNPVGSKVGDAWVVNIGTGGSATVENSDASYTDTVAAGDTLILPDTDYEVIVDGALVATGSLVTLGTSGTININL